MDIGLLPTVCSKSLLPTVCPSAVLKSRDHYIFQISYLP